jgi:hypothetical protein
MMIVSYLNMKGICSVVRWRRSGWSVTSRLGLGCGRGEFDKGFGGCGLYSDCFKISEQWWKSLSEKEHRKIKVWSRRVEK